MKITVKIIKKGELKRLGRKMSNEVVRSSTLAGYIECKRSICVYGGGVTGLMCLSLFYHLFTPKRDGNMPEVT